MRPPQDLHRDHQLFKSHCFITGLFHPPSTAKLASEHLGFPLPTWWAILAFTALLVSSFQWPLSKWLPPPPCKPFMLFTHITVFQHAVSPGLPGLRIFVCTNIYEEVSLLQEESAARNTCSGNLSPSPRVLPSYLEGCHMGQHRPLPLVIVETRRSFVRQEIL